MRSYETLLKFQATQGITGPNVDRDATIGSLVNTR